MDDPVPRDVGRMGATDLLEDAYKFLNKRSNATSKDNEMMASIMDVDRDGKITDHDINRIVARHLLGVDSIY